MSCTKAARPLQVPIGGGAALPPAIIAGWRKIYLVQTFRVPLGPLLPSRGSPLRSSSIGFEIDGFARAATALVRP